MLRFVAKSTAPVAFAVGVWMVATAAPAHADDPPCGAAVRAWVGRASADSGIPARAFACPALLARVRLSPRGAPALDVEVAEPPGPAFRHAGRFRLSPIVEVADWSDLEPERREAFDRFAAWIEAHEREVTLARGGEDAPAPAPVRPRSLDVEGIGPWLWVVGVVLAACGLLLARWRQSATATATATAAATAADTDSAGAPLAAWAPGVGFVVAVAARLMGGAWSVLHVNGQGPSWIRTLTVDATHLGSYGPGYREVLGVFASLGGAEPDETVFLANAILSALTAPLAYAIARRLDLDARRAAFAALLVAADPIAIAIGPTEAYFVPIVTLTAAAMALLLEAREAWIAGARTTRVAAIILALGGALLAAQAARIHPVAWIPVALVPLVLVVRLRGLAFGVGAAALTGLVVVATSHAWLHHVYETLSAARGPLAGVSASEPLRWIGRVVLVAVVGGALARPLAPNHVAFITGIALVLTRSAYGQSDLWQSSYDRLFLTLPIIAFAAVLPRRLFELRPTPWLAAAAIVALLAFGSRVVPPETTESLEHRFLRHRLAELDPDCTIAHVARADRRVVDIPDHGGHRPRPLAAAEDLAVLATPGRCLIYVRSSICSSRAGRPLCAAVEASTRAAGLRLTPVARKTFPARASHRELRYDSRRILVSVFRVEPRATSSAAVGPAW